MVRETKTNRDLKLCCTVTALLLVIVLVVAIVLYFTMLKPKHPKITTHYVTLNYIKWVPFPPVLNVTLGITVEVDNPNYGSFKYENSTAYVSYHGALVAEAPIEHDTVPARAKHDISTIMEVEGEKLISSPYFWADFNSQCFNFTSSATLHGKAKVLKLFKIKVTTFCTCDISISLLAQNVTSVCKSKLKY